MSSSKFHSSSPPNSIIDPRNGYCKENGIYYTLNPPLSLPPPSIPLSITSYILSLIPSPPPRHSAIIDSFLSLSYSDILSQVSSLSSALRTHLQISKGDVVFIFASVSANIPVLYLALLSIGAVVSPSNTIYSKSEIAHQIDLIKPSIIFTTSSCISDLPTTDLPTFLIDSPLFRSYLRSQYPPVLLPLVDVNQDDPAAILFSSGTTSQTKGTVLTHRNLIATVSNNSATQTSLQSLESANRVTLFANSIFHIFGISLLLTSLALGKTAVLIEKVDLETILHAVEIHQVNLLITWPSLLPSLLESNIISNFDLSSLRIIIYAGASVCREIAELFAIRFPSFKLFQVRISHSLQITIVLSSVHL
ncbi:Acetyl-CoA synthetase-like protein [Dioscorea alata]|uniref:Acetyl-CoA synthetase-like protein n=1 Tax=Dioscorea alata TaxID=55571 RepID=A0ACB7WAN5_DIOAL|nr:Acetyl-CoA synthetase-like protein [Dioscorea alata]